jgi:hypothetical protein
LSVLLSVFLIIGLLAGVSWVTFVTLRLAKSDGSFALYSHTEHLRSYGPLYAVFRAERYFFFLTMLAAALVKALVVAFGHGHGQTQLIVFIITEFFVVATTFVLKPHKTRGGDVFATFLVVVRFVCTCLMIAFIESIAVAAIPRVAIGIVIAVIFSVAVVVMFFNIAWHIVDLVFRRRPMSASELTPAGSLAEKTSMRNTPASSLARLEGGLASVPNARMEEDIHTLPNTPTTATESYRHSGATDNRYSRGSYVPQRERWSHASSPSSGSASSQLPLDSRRLSRQ